MGRPRYCTRCQDRRVYRGRTLCRACQEQASLSDAAVQGDDRQTQRHLYERARRSPAIRAYLLERVARIHALRRQVEADEEAQLKRDLATLGTDPATVEQTLARWRQRPTALVSCMTPGCPVDTVLSEHDRQQMGWYPTLDPVTGQRGWTCPLCVPDILWRRPSPAAAPVSRPRGTECLGGCPPDREQVASLSG